MSYLVIAYLVAGYGFLTSLRKDGYTARWFATWLIVISMTVWIVRNFHG